MRNSEVQPAPRRLSTFIALLLAVTCFDIASGLEHWPFGSYPMYSLTYSRHFSTLRLYGVSSAGETALRGDGNFAPFDEARLVSALARVRQSDKDGRRLTSALLNLLQLHNRNSASPIRTLRLYSVSWTLRPGLEGNEPPEQKLLLAEVTSTDR